MTRKTIFFEGWSWFKFNNFGLALGMTLEFYTSVAKGLKLSPTFVEVTGETLVGVAFLAPSSWIGLMLQLHYWNNDIIGVEIISTKHIFFLVSNLTGINGVILVSLFLTINRFHTCFWCFHYWLWTKKCRLVY